MIRERHYVPLPVELTMIMIMGVCIGGCVPVSGMVM
jgi:hypothetical protein